VANPLAAATGVAYRVALAGVGHTAVWRAAAGVAVVTGVAVVPGTVVVVTAGAVGVGARDVVGDVDELPHPFRSTAKAQPATTTGTCRPFMGPWCTQETRDGRAESPGPGQACPTWAALGSRFEGVLVQSTGVVRFDCAVLSIAVTAEAWRPGAGADIPRHVSAELARAVQVITGLQSSSGHHDRPVPYPSSPLAMTTRWIWLVPS